MTMVNGTDNEIKTEDSKSVPESSWKKPIPDPMWEWSCSGSVYNTAYHNRNVSRPGWLYFVRRLIDGAVKIGRSNNVKNRIVHFKRDHGEIELLHSMPVSDMKIMEELLHEEFESQHIGNEWHSAEIVETELFAYWCSFPEIHGSQKSYMDLLADRILRNMVARKRVDVHAAVYLDRCLDEFYRLDDEQKSQMRIFDGNPTENVWLAISGAVSVKTKKAIQIDTGDHKVWVPLSQLEAVMCEHGSEFCEPFVGCKLNGVEIPKWLMWRIQDEMSQGGADASSRDGEHDDQPDCEQVPVVQQTTG